jgi:hypothetical protein
LKFSWYKIVQRYPTMSGGFYDEKVNSAVRKAVLDPLVVTPKKAVPSPHQLTVSTNSGRPRKQPRIEVLCPTVLDKPCTVAPTNLD